MSPKDRPAECCATPAQPPEPSSRQRDRLVAALRALGDPTRFDIFRLIVAQPTPICVCDIVARFDLSQPTISHHLKILRDAGLVGVTRRGVWAYYTVEPHGLEQVCRALERLVPADVRRAG